MDFSRLPRVGYGTYKVQSSDVMREAVRTGYRFFDTATVYDNEELLGEALTGAIADGEVTRDEVFVTTKLYNDAHRPDEVEGECRKSLQKLGLDRVDLYLIHWPVCTTSKPHDTLLPPEETWEAMEGLVEKGLVRHLGVSNFGVNYLTRLLDTSRIKPVVNQVESHPYFRNESVQRFCDGVGIQFQAYTPLGMGHATWLEPPNPPTPLDDPVIGAIAKSHGVGAAQIVLRWHVHCGRVPVPKASSSSHLRPNLDAASGPVLSDDEISQINGLDKGGAGRLCNPLRMWGKWDYSLVAAAIMDVYPIMPSAGMW